MNNLFCKTNDVHFTSDMYYYPYKSNDVMGDFVGNSNLI